MRQYIVNLTNNLIGKHGFDLMFRHMGTDAVNKLGWKEGFVRLVNMTISAREVRKMSPETLGKVVCSFEQSEIPCNTPAFFFGEPDQFLRNTVSHFLAWSIRYRLDESVRAHHGRIPAYVSKRAPGREIDPGFKKPGCKWSDTSKKARTAGAVLLTLSTGLVDDDGGVISNVLAYLKENPDQILEFGIQIQDAYPEHDRRTPMVKMALVLKEALK